jgi:hypothetical protein
MDGRVERVCSMERTQESQCIGVAKMASKGGMVGGVVVVVAIFVVGRVVSCGYGRSDRAEFALWF